MALFKKAAVCTDLHLGGKSNSIQHNTDCLEFIEWFCRTGKEQGCETAIICGDWHNHRATINVLTLSYSMKCMELLNNSFSNVFMLTGNHDMFFREKREAVSTAFAGYLPNIHVINEIITDSDVTLCPWILGDEHSQVRKIKSTYTFGHFELPMFMMNAMVQMPDHGKGLKDNDFLETGTVFSGHFHKRQARGNIWYIGNAFGHSYSDAGDAARGMMLLNWGDEPEFKAWPNQPLYQVTKLSTLLDNTDTFLKPRMSLRVNIDLDLSYEEANYIKETLVPQYQLRELALIPMKKAQQMSNHNSSAITAFESVDQIVMENLMELKSEFFDPNLLLEIYRGL